MDFEKNHYFCPSPATGTNFKRQYGKELQFAGYMADIISLAL
jgi:hypothetical protein